MDYATMVLNYPHRVRLKKGSMVKLIRHNKKMYDILQWLEENINKVRGNETSWVYIEELNVEETTIHAFCFTFEEDALLFKLYWVN